MSFMQSGLNSIAKALKKNNYEVLGNVVDTARKAYCTFKNFSDAAPLPQAVRFFTKKMSLEEALRSFQKGDHIAVDRLYHITHHGIYGGNGMVAEYDGHKIKKTTLENFIQPSFYVYKVNSQAIYSPDEIWNRACQRCGEDNYNLVMNNCEHFARWCRNGD